MRLLLVERDVLTREALVESLILAGYAVTTCEDATSAWEAYSAAPFPLVVCPFSPPKRRGLSLCRRIRASQNGSMTTIVVTTARSDAGILGSIVDAGADDFVTVPVDPSTLLARLVLAMRRRRQEVIEREHGEARFHRLLNAAPDGIVAVDPQGRIAVANAQAEQLFGFETGALVGRSVDDLVSGPLPRLNSNGRPGFGDDHEGGEGAATIGRRQDGTTFPAEIRLSQIAADDGPLVIASFRDITERKRTEAALRLSEQRLRLALAAAKIGTWDWDLTTGELAWSVETERLAGVESGGSHTIDRLFELVHPDDKEYLANEIQRVLDSETEYATSYRMIMADGSTHWNEAVGRVERDSDGRPLHFRGIAMDVTARKVTEEALREGEERFRAAFEHAAIGMALVGLGGEWLRVNSSLCELFGYDEYEFLQMGGFQEITYPDDLARDLELFERLTSDEFETYQMEKRYFRKDGGLIWTLLNVSLVHDANGAPVYFVAQIQDISERKRAEEALQDAHAELGRVIGSVSDCIYSAEMLPDGSFSYRYFSPVALRTLGRPAAHFLGGPDRWFAIIHPEDRVLIDRAIDHVKTGEHSEIVTELRILWTDGSVRWIQDSVMITPRDNGTLWLDGVLTDVTERKAFEAELAHRALHDALTGLPNRPLFLDRLSHALARRRLPDEIRAVLFLDLDNFKTVNDGLGHEAGDELIRAVVARLAKRVRASDTLARFGGDEFVVLLEDLTSAEDATRTADELIAAFTAPLSVQGREVYMGISIGIALAGPDDSEPSMVLRNADAALYRAKSTGRNRSVLFDPLMTNEALARLELEVDLRRALEDGSGLLLHYQPVFDLRTHQLSGCEALVRWVHPSGKMLSPDAFIPLAEETGLIVPLGKWVLTEACRQLRRWQDEFGAMDLTVSVNLSSRHFREHRLVRQVSEVLAATGLSPKDLTLEVTEHVLIDEDARETLAELKALGVGLAIDDFGTGYSSLNYLSAIDADILKIDRRFVSSLTANGREAAIVRAVLALGESLNMTVTAEGVETVDQMLALRRLGCHRVQGFLLGRPSSAELFAGLLSSLPASRRATPVPNVRTFDDTKPVSSVFTALPFTT